MTEAAKLDHSKKHPSHIAFQVQDKEKGGKWNRIGAAWKTKDEKGFIINLTSIPMDGRIVLRINENQWGQ